jgi:hypothetical protein
MYDSTVMINSSTGRRLHELPVRNHSPLHSTLSLPTWTLLARTAPIPFVSVCLFLLFSFCSVAWVPWAFSSTKEVPRTTVCWTSRWRCSGCDNIAAFSEDPSRVALRTVRRSLVGRSALAEPQSLKLLQRAILHSHCWREHGTSGSLMHLCVLCRCTQLSRTALSRTAAAPASYSLSRSPHRPLTPVGASA